MTTDELIPQGDLRLLDTDAARLLLAAPIPAHLAWIARDGTPRTTPLNAVWNGEELVLGAFASTHKVADLAVNPAVAVSIEDHDGPPRLLQLRGRVTLAEVEGVLPEYAAAQRKAGGAAVEAYLAAIDRPGLRSVRIGLRPTWVGLIDHSTRFAGRTPAPVLAALRGEG
jgi:hypothetical protein